MSEYTHDTDRIIYPNERNLTTVSLGHNAVEASVNGLLLTSSASEAGSLDKDDTVITHDEFNVECMHAHQVISWTASEAKNPDIAFRAQQIHGESYVKYGYFNADGLAEDGRLFPELDGTREKEGAGINVTYLLAKSKHDHPSVPAGSSLRIIDIAPGGTIENLPAYGYDEKSIYPEYRMKLNNIIDLYGTGSVREIAALSTLNPRDSSGSYELMRAIVQNALVKHDKFHGGREVWIAALTDISLKPVAKFVGKSAIEIIGDPTPIYTNDSRSSKDLHVTPVMIDPCKIPEGIVDDIEASRDSVEREKLMEKLYFIADGLTESQIGPNAVSIMKILETRRAS